MITWDLETRGLGGKMLIGGVYTHELYFEFSNFEDFDFFLSNFAPGDEVFAHNGGKYDHRYLLDYFQKSGVKITNILYISNGLVFNATLSNKIFKFRDSIHILPKSLKELSKSFEVEHKKMDFDMKKWLKKKCPITDELKEYLKLDCISLFEIILKFQTTFNNKPKLTIASTAFSELLKTKYKNIPLKKLCVNTLSKNLEIFVRESYKGGRVEVFQRFAENIFKYDVNSLYPFSMFNHEYPIGKYTEVFGSECEKLLEMGMLGVCQCNIIAPDIDIPYLAKKHDNKLIFPVGKWSDVITSFEIIEARKRGYEIEINRGLFYSNKGKIFQEFINNYYTIKKNNTGAKKEIAKLFLNSAYGKWGQKREQRRIKSEFEIIMCQADIDTLQSFDGGLLYSAKEISYQNRSVNPIYATFITAYSRHNLYLGFEQILSNGGKIFYCDTDCICSDIQLPTEMIDETELGFWAYEGFFNEAVFISPKLYSMKNETEEIVRGKGVNRENIELVNYNSFYELLISHGEMSFRNERVTGVFEHFKRLDTNKNLHIQKIIMTKKITTAYTKRILIDQYKTKPIRLTLL